MPRLYTKNGLIPRPLAAGKFISKSIYVAKEEKRLFDTHRKFSTLFHTIDVIAVKNHTDYYTEQLASIEEDVNNTFDSLAFRKKISAYLMLMFAGSWIVASLLAKSYKD